jgi:hypothetical protein
VAIEEYQKGGRVSRSGVCRPWFCCFTEIIIAPAFQDHAVVAENRYRLGLDLQ